MTKPLISRIGAHVSIAGGIDQAPIRAAAEGLETFQCFSRSPQGGPAPKLTKEVLDSFQLHMTNAGFSSFVIHAPYYVNTASDTARIRESSIRILREELERGSLLGASYVMYHPGSHKGRSAEEGLIDAQRALSAILEGYTGTCKLLVEISAGAGDVIGDTFEEVALIVRSSTHREGFGGICFDSCHAFASGIDFSTPEKAAAMLSSFDSTIGLQWLRLAHVNDSKANLGERKDRHEHIGHGHIGYAGVHALLQTPPFRSIDWILETEPAGRSEDIATLSKIRDR